MPNLNMSDGSAVTMAGAATPTLTIAAFVPRQGIPSRELGVGKS